MLETSAVMTSLDMILVEKKAQKKDIKCRTKHTHQFIIVIRLDEGLAPINHKVLGIVVYSDIEDQPVFYGTEIVC